MVSRQTGSGQSRQLYKTRQKHRQQQPSKAVKVSLGQKLGLWLEKRWVSPSFGGGLLVFFTIFFFGAATNTMAGWLYVISGVLLALLVTAGVLSRRSLRSISVSRQAIAPVSVGDSILVKTTWHNQSNQPLTLSQAVDGAPPQLTQPSQTKLAKKELVTVQLLEQLEPGQSCTVHFSYSDVRRGVYCWQDITFRTAAPLGVMWASRSWAIPAKAVVYPQILPLSRCPLVDHMGKGNALRMADRDQFSQASHEG